MSWQEAELPSDFFGRDMVRAIIVGRHSRDLYVTNDFTHHLRNLPYLEVVVSHVIYAAINLLGRPLKAFQIEIGHIVDVDIRTHLIATEDFDDAIGHSVIRQDIDGKVETQACRITANRRWPKD